MDTKLQPLLRALHRIIPVSRSPELSSCLQNGESSSEENHRAPKRYKSATESERTAFKDPVEIDESMIAQADEQRDTGPTPSAVKLQDCCKCCPCTRESCGQFLQKLFPFTTILKGYSVLYDLPCDVIAGLTVGIMQIPQGMAYALLTQLPPVYGLYVSFFPVLVYFFFGTSKHISVGTFAVITMMIGSVVDKGHVAWQEKELQGAIHDINTGHNITHYVGDEDIPADGTSVNESINGSGHLYRSEHLDQLASLKVGYAMAVTSAVGVLQLFLGILRLGFLTAFLSDPLISGFTTGAAIHVFSSQIKSAFGVKVQRFSGPFKIIFLYKDFFWKINRTNLVTLSATAVAVVTLLIIREGINNRKVVKEKLRGIPVPGELILIIIGTVLSHQLCLQEDFGVEVIGHIPKGFPAFSVTFVKYLPDVIGESFAIGFTAFAISFAIAKILADKNDYVVDPNQELIAHGLSNLLGSMFSCFCSAASLSRSMVQEGVGGKTQIVSLVSCVIIVVVLLTLGPLFEKLPNSILAAIIMVSLKGLFLQFGDLGTLWKVSKVDCSVWLVTFTFTVFLDIDMGLLIGLIYNLVPILLRTQRAYCCLLGRIPDTDVFRDTRLYPNAAPVPGIKIFHFDAPLYFANIESFKAALITETALNPHDLKLAKANKKDLDSSLRHHEVCMETANTCPTETDEKNDQTKPATRHYFPPVCDTFAIVIDGSGIQNMDSVTARVLTGIVLEYREVGIDVLLGECKVEVRTMLNNSGMYSHIHRRNVCATIAQAVQVAQKTACMSSESLIGTDTMEPEEFLGIGTYPNLEAAVEEIK